MGLHLQMCTGPQFGKHSGDGVITIFIQQRGQPAMAQIQRTHLRVQITIDRQRQTGIGAQDRQDIILPHTGTEQLDRRDMHPFLKALGGCRVVISGHIAANIMPVANGCEVTEYLSVAEHRADKLEVRQVCAALIGIIENIDIAIHGRVVAGQFDDMAHGKGHDPDKDRQAFLALHKGFTGLGIIQPVRGIMCFGNNRVEGAAEQRCIHFIGNLFQPAAQHGKLHRIDCRGALRAFGSAHLLNLSSS